MVLFLCSYPNQFNLVSCGLFETPEVKWPLLTSPFQPLGGKFYSEKMNYPVSTVHLLADLGLRRSFSGILACKCWQIVLNPLAFLYIYFIFFWIQSRYFCSVFAIWPRYCWRIYSPEQNQHIHIFPILLLCAIFIEKKYPSNLSESAQTEEKRKQYRPKCLNYTSYAYLPCIKYKQHLDLNLNKKHPANGQLIEESSKAGRERWCFQ